MYFVWNFKCECVYRYVRGERWGEGGYRGPIYMYIPHGKGKSHEIRSLQSKNEYNDTWILCNHYYYRGTTFYYISCLFVFPMKKKIYRLGWVVKQINRHRQICLKILRLILLAIQHKHTINILGLKLNMFLYLYLYIGLFFFFLKRFDVTSKIVSTIRSSQVASWPWVQMLQFS